jgi:hypothetical protein
VAAGVLCSQALKAMIEDNDKDFVVDIVGTSGDGFREGKSRMVQRQQQIMGEPSEREALLTILLSYACKEVLRSYLTLGCERTYIAS